MTRKPFVNQDQIQVIMFLEMMAEVVELYNGVGIRLVAQGQMMIT